MNITSTQNCTGCGACYNTCPKNAISMQLNELGFLEPVVDAAACIDCSLCVKICPKQNEVKSTDPAKETFYAVWNKNKEQLKRSSSGGLFCALAGETIRKGGVVFGATWADGEVYHIAVESEQELPRLMGSRYSQSDTRQTFSEVKKALEGGRYVLFTGTPCQVAGLKHYLKKDDDRLLCMDVLCHGVPTRFLMDRCKRDLETQMGSPISDMRFRDKTYGWRGFSMRYFFRNGKDTVEHCYVSPYMRGFVSDLALNAPCYTCPYVIGKYESDITAGDAWGINKVRQPFWNHKGGVSVAAAHTERGRKALKEASHSLVVRPIPRQKAARFNDRLFNHTTNIPIKREAYIRALADAPGTLKEINSGFISGFQYKLDVVILGLWMHRNYGGLLTSFALYKTVVGMGYEASLVDHMACYPCNNYGDVFWRFLRSQQVRVSNAPTLRSAVPLANSARTILVGSDQVWNPYCGYEHFFFLDWAHAGNKKVAYASSLGNNMAPYAGTYLDRAKRYLSRFDAVSVREEQSVATMKSVFGVEATQQLDPVFLVDADTWRGIAGKDATALPDSYLLAYLLNPTAAQREGIYAMARQQGLKHIVLIYDVQASVNAGATPEGLEIHTLTAPTIPLWLKAFMQASFVVTDSFHGSCFSLIFHKQFLSIANATRGRDRFISLMHQFKLEGRLVEENDSLACPADPIPYDALDLLYSELKASSLAWLQGNLKSSERSPELEKLNRQVEQELPPSRNRKFELKRYLMRHYPELFTLKRKLMKFIHR